MKTIVHVNRHIVEKNRRDCGQRPVYTVKRGGKTVYAHAVIFSGPVTLIDPRERKPLPCGARVYLETEAEVVLIGPCAFEDAKDAA